MKRRSGDSWSYSFSSKNIIEGTFKILRIIKENGGAIHKRKLSEIIKDLTEDRMEPPRLFLEQLELIRPISGNYNITEKGRKVAEMIERGVNIVSAKEIFEIVKERYQVARYLDKFITSPGRQSFKRKEFDEFVINEWLLDFGYEKDDKIDRDNALGLAEWLGLIKWNDEKQEYQINKEIKPEFSHIEFLMIIRELATFRNEWLTLDLCEKLRIRYKEYMADPPEITFILDRLIELQKENSNIIEFSPGWPTPPIPSSYALIKFDPKYVAIIQVPTSWRTVRIKK